MRIVTGEGALRGTEQIGHDELDARVQLARTAFGVGDDPLGLVPSPGMVAAAWMVTWQVVRQPADRSLEKMGDAGLEYPGRRENEWQF